MSMNSNLIEPNGGGMRAAESLKLKVSLEGRESGVTMEVYDVGGRLRAVPYNNVAVSGGSCELEWNGRDMNGRVVGGETYVVVVTVWNVLGYLLPDSGIRMWPERWWFNYLLVFLGLHLVLSPLTAVWLTLGGYRDLRRMFELLRRRQDGAGAERGA